MSEWRETTLGEVCSRVTSGGTPKSNTPEYYNGIIPWLNTKEINFNSIYETEKTITEQGLENSSAKWIKENAVIVAMYGATAGKVAISKIPLTTNQACCNLEVDPEISDFRYIYYYIFNNYVKISSLANGGAQQNLNAGQIKEFPIPLPPLPEQKAIADTLSCLDEKIESNNKINQTLEEMAQAIFKRLVDSSVASKSEIVELKELCSFQEGYVNPSQKHQEYFDGDVKWLRAVDLNNSFVLDTSRTLTTEGFKSAKKSAILFEPDTIAISKSGTIGRLGIVADYMCGNRAVINIRPKEKYMLPFIYYYLKSIQHTLGDLAVGTVQKNLYISLLEPLAVKIPDPDSLKDFCSFASNSMEIMKNNCKENKTLAEIRNTLLPKLMSGEVRVPVGEVE